MVSSSAMFSRVAVSVLVLCVVSIGAAESWKPASNTNVPAWNTDIVEESSRSVDENRWWLPVAQLKAFQSLYDDCIARDADYGASCLKGKALVYLARAMDKETIALGEGVTLVRSGASGEQHIDSDEQLNANLPRDLNQREERLDEMLFNHVTSFLQTHTIKMDLSGRALLETVNEARQKIKKGKIGKKGSPLLLLAMLATGKFVLAYSLKAIALLAAKALIIGKIALVLVAVIGLHKLFHHKESEHSHHEASEKVSTMYAHKPYHASYGRSLGAQEAAHRLAYNVQKPRTQ